MLDTCESWDFSFWEGDLQCELSEFLDMANWGQYASRAWARGWAVLAVNLSLPRLRLALRALLGLGLDETIFSIARSRRMHFGSSVAGWDHESLPRWTLSTLGVHVSACDEVQSGTRGLGRLGRLIGLRDDG